MSIIDIQGIFLISIAEIQFIHTKYVLYIYINGRIINKQIPKSHNNPTYMEPQEKTNIYIYIYIVHIYIYTL